MKGGFKHILLLVGVLIIAFVANILLAGSSVLKFSELNFDDYIFRNIRLSKALTALLCGISLPIAGQILQVLFRNPLAGPYVLGISHVQFSGRHSHNGLKCIGVMGYVFFQKRLLLLRHLPGVYYAPL